MPLERLTSACFEHIGWRVQARLSAALRSDLRNRQLLSKSALHGMLGCIEPERCTASVSHGAVVHGQCSLKAFKQLCTLVLLASQYFQCFDRHFNVSSPLFLCPVCLSFVLMLSLLPPYRRSKCTSQI